MACCVTVTEPPLWVTLQNKSKAFPPVQEEAIGKSHQAHFYWLHFREPLPIAASAVAGERAGPRECWRQETEKQQQPTHFPSLELVLSLGPWGREARVSREEEEPVLSSQAQAPQVETHLYLGRAVQTGFIPTCLRFKSSFSKAFPSVASGPPREDRVPMTPKTHVHFWVAFHRPRVSYW